MDTKDKHEYSPELMMAEAQTMLPPADLLEASTLPAAAAAAPVVIEPGKVAQKSLSPGQESMRRFRRDKRAMISLGLLVFFILLALIGPFIYQHIGGTITTGAGGHVGPEIYHSYSEQDLLNTNMTPTWDHWAGTDQLGRDMLARLMQGLLISLLVALSVEIVDIVLGVTVGVLAGYYGKWIDQFLARFTDIMFAFPGLLFVILLTGIFGSWAVDTFSKWPLLGNGNARLLLVAIASAISVWPLMARFVRGQTLQLKEQQFIEAARTSGATDWTIITKHIIPNLFSIVFISSTLNVAGIIIGEAGISLLGLGVQAPGSSLGLMISNGLEFVEPHPWGVLFPTGVLTIIVLCISFMGDGLRDAFDPRSKD
jgi:ABC-type dipeptide/oligopeptide/nickel transport system permease subunit